MSDPGVFDDYEPETDDDEAIEAYATELRAAVDAFVVPVLEPGEFRDPVPVARLEDGF